jgi:twinkle protein
MKEYLKMFVKQTHFPIREESNEVGIHTVNIEGVIQPNQLLDKFYTLNSEPGLEIPLFGSNLRFLPSRLTVMTGMPGHGKGMVVDNSIIQFIKKYGLKFALYSPENFPYENHIRNLLPVYTQKEYKTPVSDQSKADIDNAIQTLSNHIYYIEPKEGGSKIADILEMTGNLVKEAGINFLVIDPWNEVLHSRDKHLTETEYISEALMKMRNFSKKMNIHMIIVAHPTKIEKNTNGSYNVPTLYDIAGSAHWRNKADNGIIVYRNGSYTELYIAKVRNEGIEGYVGKIDCTVNVSNKVITPVQSGKNTSELTPLKRRT